MGKKLFDYVIGNPPFVGARLMNKDQKADVSIIFEGWKKAGNLDYVSCWYKKTSEMMKGTKIHAALVSTNSVSQGENVAILWKPLFEEGIIINFAHQTFRWDSEASVKAHVHCVIIGFSFLKDKSSEIFSSERSQVVGNINGYLNDGPNVFIESRKRPICQVPSVVFGSMPNDGGYLSNYSNDEKSKIVLAYPESAKFFRRYLGATEFINNKTRWCLWLEGISPAELKKIPPVIDAIASVKKMREGSNREATRKLADKPMLFGEIRQPKTTYIIIPRHSSQNRRYIPMGFIEPDIICGDANLLMPEADRYHFGIMSSNVHNAWVRTICGRIKSDFRYSVNIVYNNFPWPSPTPDQCAKIEQTAQAILDARALYPDSSLADLYDELTMPPELRRAHQNNDRAVMAAYGFPVKGFTEADCVAELMKLYQQMTEGR